jgi:hypothetical protein
MVGSLCGKLNKNLKKVKWLILNQKITKTKKYISIDVKLGTKDMT